MRVISVAQCDRLAGIGHLSGDELLGPGLDDLGGPAQHGRPLGHGGAPPGAGQRDPPGMYRAVHERVVGAVHDSGHGAVDGVDTLEGLVRPVDDRAVDKVTNSAWRGSHLLPPTLVSCVRSRLADAVIRVGDPQGGGGVR